MNNQFFSAFLRFAVYTLINISLCPLATANPHHPTLTFSDALTEMKKAGVEKVGGKTLDQLVKEAGQIEIEVIPELRFQNIENKMEGVHRGSGFWNKEAQKIYISEKHLSRMTLKHFRWVIVHEFLEILEAGDKNFHKSALMDAISSIIAINKRKPGFIRSEKAIRPLANQLNSSKGGISGVGGGGDGRILSYMKLIYLELFFRLNENLMTETQFHQIGDFMKNLDVEFSSEIQQGTFIFDQVNKILRIPLDPTVGRNYDLNSEAIIQLVDLWIQTLVQP